MSRASETAAVHLAASRVLRVLLTIGSSNCGSTYHYNTIGMSKSRVDRRKVLILITHIERHSVLSPSRVSFAGHVEAGCAQFSVMNEFNRLAERAHYGLTMSLELPILRQLSQPSSAESRKRLLIFRMFLEETADQQCVLIMAAATDAEEQSS